jgi:Protein of unknown function (DUF1501)
MTRSENNNPVETEALSRRHFLWQSAGGLGGIALAAMLADESGALEAVHGTHFPAKAKRVIQIFCCGGVSHIDTFDYKPELIKMDGKECKRPFDTFFNQPGNLMKSPFEFKQHGKSGKWVSSLLPHLAECVDDITFLHSMKAKSANHTPATFQMNSGFTINGFPCLGAWLSYGLGSENKDLPDFVVLPDPRGLPAGGAINWTSGFLPASHQGTAFNSKGAPVDNLFPPGTVPPSERAAAMHLATQLNHDFAAKNPGDTTLQARIHAYELAARMQTSIPDAVNFEAEPEHIKKLYGLEDPISGGFARNCLLARRLAEKGVRFVQIYHGGAFGSPRINWDAHEGIVENHTNNARIMDQPVAALIADLKQRGMLKDTLILWTTEFGRTPITQGVGQTGRDHHPLAYTCWMAGAGLKPGMAFGATDEIGYDVAENPLFVYDFHATVLHLLGLDHKRLTYYHNGIRRRLTDVHGDVVQPILA